MLGDGSAVSLTAASLMLGSGFYHCVISNRSSHSANGLGPTARSMDNPVPQISMHGVNERVDVLIQ